MKYLNFSKYYVLNFLILFALFSNFLFIFYAFWMFIQDTKSLNAIENFIYHVGDITFYYFICFIIYLLLIIAFAIELILRKLNKIQTYNKLEYTPIIRRIVLWIGLLSIPASALGFYIFIVLIATFAAVMNMI